MTSRKEQRQADHVNKFRQENEASPSLIGRALAGTPAPWKPRVPRRATHDSHFASRRERLSWHRISTKFESQYGYILVSTSFVCFLRLLFFAGFHIFIHPIHVFFFYFRTTVSSFPERVFMFLIFSKRFLLFSCFLF